MKAYESTPESDEDESPTPTPTKTFGDHPPFLEQAKAQNALRREWERLSAVQVVELSTLPNRFLARNGTTAISFSWLSGRLGGIADGRLLVIQWDGVLPTARGFAALKAANQTRETSYLPEANDDRSWQWRAAEARGRACTTLDLVGQWCDAVVPA
jgi:hypothetical protein